MTTGSVLQKTIPICMRCIAGRGLAIAKVPLCPETQRPIVSHGKEGKCPLHYFAGRSLVILSQTAGGPGTELTLMFEEFEAEAEMSLGFKGCKCKSLAARMDRWGPDGCETHMAEIIAGLRENWEAVPRPCAFDAEAAEWMVREAVRRAKEKQERR